MNVVLGLLALTCATSAYNNGVYVANQINYRRSEQPTESDITVDETDDVTIDAMGEGNKYIPAYTKWLRDIEIAFSDVTSHLLRTDSNAYNPDDPFVQYVMIVNAVNELIDASLEGVDEYESVFYDVVSKAILESVNTPQESADKVRAQIDKTINKISAIKNLIEQKQQTSCEDDISYTCDLIIGIAVEMSEDNLLKTQANFMSNLSVQVELFLSGYDNEFNDVSHNNRASTYLINGIDILRPLVMAGVHTRNTAKDIPPTRRMGGSYFRPRPWLL